MNIGEMINKFDLETDGTVKSFNELFEMCPIKLDVSPESIVEIGGIVSAGQETKRLLWVDEELTEHLFERERAFRPDDKRSYNPKSKMNYILENLDTGEVFKANTLEELSEESKIARHKIGSISQGRTTSGNFKLEKRKIKREQVITKPKKKWKYIVERNGEVHEFSIGKEVAKFLNVTKTTVSFYATGKWKNQDGWNVEKKEY